MNRSANYWPTAEQSLLLKAALIADETQARRYWADFCCTVDMQKIDYSTTCMTPLVYKRFRDLHGSEIQVAKSVYRHTWCNNNLSFHALRKVLSAFSEEEIPVTLLKGVAMIANYYRDSGLRVVGDIDILVPRDRVKVAIELLRKAGWHQLNHLNESEFDNIHATPFKNSDGVNIDLHWRILGDASVDLTLINFQPEVRSALNFSGYTLCPEDQLIHILLHCHKYSPVPMIRWIPDASVILNQTLDFRWDYFLKTVKALKVEYVMQSALMFLHTEKYIDLQEPVLHEMGKLHWKKSDQQYFDILSKPISGRTVSFLYYWHLHIRNNPDITLFSLIVTLPKFVMQRINVDGYGGLLRYEMARYFKYLSSKFRSNTP
jgi:hypothetical protein